MIADCATLEKKELEMKKMTREEMRIQSASKAFAQV